MSGGPAATHIVAMTKLSRPHTRIVPLTYEVTVLDDDDSKHVFQRTNDCYPDDAGKYTRDRYTDDVIDFHGSYWVREVGSDGTYTGQWDLLTYEEFRDQYGPQGFEYGLQMPGRPRDVIEVGGDLVRANDELAKPENNGRTLVRRPFIEESDWEVVE